jgi:Leu/Phe-tRNA-protein transferase
MVKVKVYEHRQLCLCWSWCNSRGEVPKQPRRAREWITEELVHLDAQVHEDAVGEHHVEERWRGRENAIA